MSSGITESQGRRKPGAPDKVESVMEAATESASCGLVPIEPQAVEKPARKPPDLIRWVDSNYCRCELLNCISFNTFQTFHSIVAGLSFDSCYLLILFYIT